MSRSWHRADWLALAEIVISLVASLVSDLRSREESVEPPDDKPMSVPRDPGDV